MKNGTLCVHTKHFLKCYKRQHKWVNPQNQANTGYVYNGNRFYRVLWLLKFNFLFQIIRSEKSSNWTLQIKFPQIRDSGIYECQVNTEPKMSLPFRLNVIGEYFLYADIFDNLNFEIKKWWCRSQLKHRNTGENQIKLPICLFFCYYIHPVIVNGIVNYKGILISVNGNNAN